MEKKLRLNREAIYQEKPPFPHNMLVEITNLCNHSCIFCAHRKMERKQRFCDREKMMSIIEQAFSHGTREIGFYMAGEPFLSKDLEYFVENCKKIGFEYIYVTTNGVFANKDRVYNLCKLGLMSIKISVDAGTKETYRRIHGKDDYEKVIQNIRDLIELKKEGLDFGLFASFCMLKSNKAEVEIFMNQIGDYLDDVYISEAVEQCGNTMEIMDELINSQAKLGKVPCKMLFNRLHVTCEGYLNACCLDIDNLLAIADLNKVSITDAWNSEEMIKLRRQHLNGKIGNNMCFRCIYGESERKISPITKELANIRE